MPFSIEEQKKIIENIIKGNKNDFIKLIQPYYEKLYQISLSFIKDEFAAEDILQEALIKAYRSLEKFKNQSRIYTWLYRIVINECYDYLKKRNKENLIFIDFDYKKENLSFEDTSIKNFELSEEREHLINMIDRLDHKYKELIFMKYFLELSYEEIAEIKNIKIGTVKSRIFKAKELLLKNFYKLK